MRVVVDPNVLISAAVATGVSAQLVDRWLTERPFEIVTCPALLTELDEVLRREKFRLDRPRHHLRMSTSFGPTVTV